VDTNGNSYVTGTFHGTASFGSSTYTSAGSGDIYVAKYGPFGNVLWSKQTGGWAFDVGHSIAADAAGNCHVAGYFETDSIQFDNFTLGIYGQYNMFAAKLASCAVAPPQPAAIAGSTTPCAGSPTTFSITPVANATSYVWTLPGGWTGTSTTASITATPGTTGGAITVAAVNTCGTGPVRSFTVSSVLAAPSPIIQQAGNTLSTTAAFSSYQWYYNGSPIIGATGQSHTPIQGGSYYVVVTNAANCSGQSTTLVITLGIDEPGSSAGFTVYPNPISGDAVHVRLTFGEAGSITLSDLTGRKLRAVEITGSTREFTIDMKGLPAGVYLLKRQSTEGMETLRVIKE
jgi:hypothetical protein